MSHSYISCRMHYVFSTKNRQPFITPELAARLWPYLGGIANANHIIPFAIGGIENHIHIFVGLPATVTIAKAIQLIKGGSSKWIHDTFPEHHGFAWQKGYGGFSVGVSDMARTVRYIQRQAEHHRRMSFETEFLAFLKKHDYGL